MNEFRQADGSRSEKRSRPETSTRLCRADAQVVVGARHDLRCLEIDQNAGVLSDSHDMSVALPTVMFRFIPTPSSELPP